MKQVVSTYAWFAAELSIFIAATVEKSWWVEIPGAILLGIPWILRKRAVEKVRAAELRKQTGFSPELSE